MAAMKPADPKCGFCHGKPVYSASHWLGGPRRVVGTPRRGEQEYAHAADEIKAARREDPMMTWEHVADCVGMSASWCRALVQWRTNPQQQTVGPFGRTDDQQARDDRSAVDRAVTRRPEVVVDALRNAPPEVRDEIASSLAAMTPAPPQYEGTAADYLRDPAPDPSDRETDQLAMKVARIAHEGRTRVERFGVWTMGDPADSIRDLDSAMTDIGEWRAALTEYVNERALS